MHRRRVPIYYDDKAQLCWIVPYKDAKGNVEIDGSLLDAIMGNPGKTIGCHLSNCAMSNKRQFPHPCYYASFVRSVAYIVDKIDPATGEALHCVRYEHRLSHLLDLNDTDKGKELVKKHPEIAVRSFTLYKPYKVKRSAATGRRSQARPSNHHPKRWIPSGAQARAKRAGLI